MDRNDTVILIVLCLVGLYYYSNESLLRNHTIEKKYGSINVPSEGEEDEKIPTGHVLGSMTFQGHSQYVSEVWYA